MNPLTGLVGLTANGIPPIKERAPPPPPSTYELRAKKRTAGSLTARSARKRVPAPPTEARQALPMSARRPGEGAQSRQGGMQSPNTEAVSGVISVGFGPRPPAYATRFGWSADEQRQWLARARRKRWQLEGKQNTGRERPRVGIVQSEASVGSIASVASIPQDERAPLNAPARWCRKAGRWVAEPPSEDSVIREAAERSGIAPAVVRSPILPRRILSPCANRHPDGPQAAAARAPGVALTTLRAGLVGAADAIEDLSVPSMQDGLDDGSGAWWDPDGGAVGTGKMFPPLKPALRDNISSMVSLRLTTPGERGRQRAEPLSLAGKQSKMFYGVEVLEHLDTVRNNLSSPLPSTRSHMQKVSESTSVGQLAIMRKQQKEAQKDEELLQLWSQAAEIGEHNTRMALGRRVSGKGVPPPRWVDVAVNEHVFSQGGRMQEW